MPLTDKLSRVRTDQIKERLSKETDPKRQLVKRFELEFAQILFGTGISDGEAYTIAERLAQQPVSLAMRLHKISNAFLTAAAGGSSE